jgi:hypothetical protein
MPGLFRCGDSAEHSVSVFSTRLLLLLYYVLLFKHFQLYVLGSAAKLISVQKNRVQRISVLP